MALSQTMLRSWMMSEGPKLRRWLIKECWGSIQDAEELLQQTYEIAWRCRCQLTTENPRSWLYQIARNQSSNWRRRKRPLVDLEVEGLPSDSVRSSLQIPSDPFIQRQLERCLERLSPLERRLFAYRFGLEPAPGEPTRGPLSYEEMSVLVTPRGEAPWRVERLRGRVFQAVATMRACLQSTYGEFLG